MILMSDLTGLGYRFSAGVPKGRGDSTPWGAAEEVRLVRRDDIAIVQVFTASHGGYYVPEELLSRIPKEHQEYARQWSGSPNWYEEDCAWAYVALALPDLFSDEALDAARATVTWIENQHPSRT